jgi:hypothetical protein
VSIEGENMRGVTWVVVQEVGSGDWASEVAVTANVCEVRP